MFVIPPAVAVRAIEVLVSPLELVMVIVSSVLLFAVNEISPSSSIVKVLSFAVSVIPPAVAVRAIAASPVPEPFVRVITCEAAVALLVKTRLFLLAAVALSSVIV